ncbi:MAG TPA: tripartite tricarboxylate transporter substrate binding protein [Vicinamibacterales bacterium]|jgi:tripartite-type tricarboxylate transporter receptor subunit TctC|nr:tripartite tricarboxylate transporter substrate binding protein [Vicinamibacterales bacterium]
MNHRLRIRRAASLLVTVCAGLCAPPAAFAEDAWPGRTITYVVPYPPGGTTDILGRTIAQRLGEALKTTVIVDNKAGATGTIGGAFVARAAPDGQTLLGTSIGPQAIAPHLMKLTYDPVKAYEPVSLIGTVPHVLVVKVSAPFTTVAQLVATAKDKPGSVSFASGGTGTILQMQGELLRLQTKTTMIHVPYKGDVPALQDVIGGQATFMFAPIAAALPHIKSGRLRALAVTSAKRSASLPDVPTMGEAGFKDFVVEQWQAIYAPAETPAPIVQRLHDEVSRILKDKDVVTSLEKVGVTVVDGAPAELARRQAADSARWATVIREAGIKLD